MNRAYVSRSLAAVVTLVLLLLAVSALSTAIADRAAGQAATPETLTRADGPALEPHATPLGRSGCQKNANNPHIARSMTPDHAKGFGEILKCNSKKDYLYIQTTLWIKGDDGDRTWNVADRSTTETRNRYKWGIGAASRCNNTRDNWYYTEAYVYVRNNGGEWADRGYSGTEKLNCGPG